MLIELRLTKKAKLYGAPFERAQCILYFSFWNNLQSSFILYVYNILTGKSFMLLHSLHMLYMYIICVCVDFFNKMDYIRFI